MPMILRYLLPGSPNASCLEYKTNGIIVKAHPKERLLMFLAYILKMLSNDINFIPSLQDMSMILRHLLPGSPNASCREYKSNGIIVKAHSKREIAYFPSIYMSSS